MRIQTAAFIEKQQRLPLDERIWRMVRRGRPDECWPWTGHITKLGYGCTHWYENNRRVTRHAHQGVWRLTNGPIPSGLCVLHRCDNRACCNPAHLWLGTVGDNNRDRHAKRRDARSFGNGMARLTPEACDKIKGLAHQGMKRAAIARTLGLKWNVVGRFLAGKTYAEVR